MGGPAELRTVAAFSAALGKRRREQRPQAEQKADGIQAAISHVQEGVRRRIVPNYTLEWCFECGCVRGHCELETPQHISCAFSPRGPG